MGRRWPPDVTVITEYVCPVIGSGTEIDPFRPKIAEYDLAWEADIPSDPVTGRPTIPRVLVRVTSGDLSLLQQDPDIQPVG
jgi:hypothetical protein